MTPNGPERFPYHLRRRRRVQLGQVEAPVALGELSAQCADLVARREMLDAVLWPGVACLVGEERVGVDPAVSIVKPADSIACR